MRIRLFDVTVRAWEDGKQVWPPPRVPASPPPPSLSAAGRCLLGFGLAALVAATLAFLAWWDGYLP
jgi:hypothetical protein